MRLVFRVKANFVVRLSMRFFDQALTFFFWRRKSSFLLSGRNPTCGATTKFDGVSTRVGQKVLEPPARCVLLADVIYDKWKGLYDAPSYLHVLFLEITQGFKSRRRVC